MRSRPTSVSAFSTTAEPSGARIVSMPLRGSKKENSAAMRAFFIWHMKFAFCSHLGCAGIEAGVARVALGQGEGAVPRDAAARLHLRHLQRLRRQTLYRIAVQIFDSHLALPLESHCAWTHLECQRVRVAVA